MFEHVSGRFANIFPESGGGKRKSVVHIGGSPRPRGF